MKTKALCLCALVAALLLASAASGQTLIEGAQVDPAERDRTFFVNRLMRQVIIPANAPANPDQIPVGYRAELPDTSAARVAEPGDHFWRFTNDLVERYDLYAQWVEAGKPVPVGAFATAALPTEASLVMEEQEEDTAQAAAPPPAPAEPEVADVPWWRSPTVLILVLLLVLLLAAVFVWSRRERTEEAA